MSHLPVLQIIVPLLAAPVCVLLRQRQVVRGFAVAVTFGAVLLSVLLTQQVVADGVVSYHVGGWEPPWGIELRADALTVFVLLVVTSVAATVLLIGMGEKTHTVPDGQESFFYAAYLLCLSGLIGMTMTGDAFNAFVFLEIASLSTYTLVALGKSRRALSAAISYLMIGTVGGTFFLLGVGLLYQLTGSLNMLDIANRLEAVKGSRTLLVAVGFLLVGISIKVAVFPLHQWLPNAYAFAPSSVSAFLAGTATKVSYYLLVRFIYTVLGASLVFGTLGVGRVLIPLSLAAMFLGAGAAIFQTDFKRLLAYSSVSQLGYMTLALGLGTQAGLQAGLLHMANHAAMKAGLFLVAAAVIAKIGSAKLEDFAGLGKRMPMTMAALVVGGFGLIGVPGTSGFISKWQLVVATLENGQPWLALMVLLSSLLAVAYVWKVVEVAYFQKSEQDAPTDDPPEIVIPAWVLTGAVIFFGVFPEWPLELSANAASALFGGAQ